MAKCLINMLNQSIDIEALTAEPNDVLSGKTFIGKGSAESQTGDITDLGSPSYTLPLNGTLNLEEGNYSGGKITQNIQTLGEQNITPGSKPITIPTQDKYMTGNIVLTALDNLKPENIKKGEYVGGVGPGTWEGYINNDKDRPFYRGTLAPGQSTTAFPRKQNGNAGILTYTKKYIVITEVTSSNSAKTQTAFVFNQPINLTNLSELYIDYFSTGDINNTLLRVYICRNKVTNYLETSSGTNPDLGEILVKNKGLKANGATIDVTSFDREAYLYITFSPTYISSEHRLSIYEVTFE